MAIGKGSKEKRTDSLRRWTICDPDPYLEFQPCACDLTAWLLLCFGPFLGPGQVEEPVSVKCMWWMYSKQEFNSKVKVEADMRHATCAFCLVKKRKVSAFLHSVITIRLCSLHMLAHLLLLLLCWLFKRQEVEQSVFS